jgi:DUF438 domain-containing protein
MDFPQCGIFVNQQDCFNTTKAKSSGNFLYIRHLAVRYAKGFYRCNLETSQDLTATR